jgi:Tol biopolymer transport system component
MWTRITPLIALCLLCLAGCSNRTERLQSAISPSVVVATTAATVPASSATAASLPTSAPAANGRTLPPAPGARHESLALVTRDQSIVLRDLAGGNGKERGVTSAPPGTVPGFPAWSPDGRRFLYVLDKPFSGDARTDWGADLYEANADGGRQRLLLRHDAPGAEIESPVWTPDGRAIVFGYAALTFDAQGNFQSERYEVRRLDPGSGALSTILDNAASPGLCADGSLLASVRFDPQSNSRVAVDVSNADGSDRRTVLTATPDAQAFLYPRFSPDCRRLVVAAIDATGADRPSAAPQPRLVSLVQHGGRFANSGSRTAPTHRERVTAAHGSPWELWSVGVDGGERRRLTHLAEDEPYAAWSADGRSLLFIGAGGLYTLDADGSHLKKIGDGATHGQLAWLQR